MVFIARGKQAHVRKRTELAEMAVQNPRRIQSGRLHADFMPQNQNKSQNTLSKTFSAIKHVS